MAAHNVGKWISMAVIAWGSANAVVSCGSSGGNGSAFDDAGVPGSDGSSVLNDGTVGVSGDGPKLVGDDGGGDGGCTPKSCQDLGYNCGQNSDGCGGSISCGACPAGQKCGNGGFSKCGPSSTTGSDGGSICTPTTCLALGYDCGYAGDGCGNSLNCNGDGGGCAPPKYCGGGGFNKCGGNSGLAPDGGVPCTPTTCQALGYNCGYADDGCGNLLNCNGASGCTPPQFCGGGGFNQCGGNSGVGPDGAASCTPVTCQKLGYNCGPAGDGCGGVLDCNQVSGGCQAPNTCGGGGKPGQCGNSNCTGLCGQQVNCGAGVVTTITGRVVAGTLPTYGTPDPVPNVLVYVPSAPLQTFKPGVQCSTCGAEVSGSPLVETTTAYDGTFTLKNVPASAASGVTQIPVVIQLGRWRREVTFKIPQCVTTAVGDIRMPRNQSEGSIPLTAISTGAVDSIECVLLKMGVDQAEFTASSGGGRVHLYSSLNDYDNNNLDGAGASLPGSLAESALMGANGTYMSYDQILFPCWGARFTKSSTELGNLVTYANAGGHFFATHFSYSWLFQNTPFNTVAKWNADADYKKGNTPPSSMTANVNLPPTNPKGTVFSNWLQLVGAMPNPQNIALTYPRHDVDTVVAPTVDWIDGHDNVTNSFQTLHLTFDTPVGQTNQCGHVIYSDFHVTNAADDPTTTFPDECDGNPLTAQEKVLEYMIWDLASCVPGPPTPPSCTPITCQDQNITCGPAGDGCGNLIASCGTCTPPQTCGGGGVPGQCGAPDGGSCTPKTCQQQNINCGPAGDGCGNQIPSCGTCTPPQTCGGGGVGGQCGYPDAGQCQPQTCAQQNIFCGPAGDGCGNLIPSCGTCTPPQTCGGGGVGGQCGASDAGSCTPKSCADQSIQCGTASDGCGNVLTCPGCPVGYTCNTQTGKCQQTSQ
jgi:hypothetical protein